MAILNTRYYDIEDGGRYSDGVVEEELLERVRAGDTSLADDPRWEIFYHMSPLRENLLNWYPFRKTDSVLELGAGPGGLTGMLCERAGQVTACELSLRRAEINYLRNRRRENLEIVAGDFLKIPWQEQYDYVIVVGVLEYAALMCQAKDPCQALLAAAAQRLKPGGKLLLAIENRFGIKYFSGAPEDHTGHSFSGINGYVQGEQVRTFTRNELDECARKAGLAVLRRYYPFPDYKFPQEILSDETIHERVPQCVDRWLDQPRTEFFPAESALRTLVKDGCAASFANSFLYELGKEDVPATDFAYVKINRDRADAFAHYTFFRTGEERVCKAPLTEAAREHLWAMTERRYQSGRLRAVPMVRTESGIACQYLKAPSLEELLCGAETAGDKSRYDELLCRLRDDVLLGSEVKNGLYGLRFRTVFGREELHTPLHWKAGQNIDLTAKNIFCPAEDDWVVIDNEWEFEFAVPCEFVLWRTLIQLPSSFFYRDAREAAERLLGVTEEMWDVFYRWEVAFEQGYVGVPDLSAHIQPCRRLDVQEMLRTMNEQEKRLQEQLLALEERDGTQRELRQAAEEKETALREKERILASLSDSMETLRKLVQRQTAELEEEKSARREAEQEIGLLREEKTSLHAELAARTAEKAEAERRAVDAESMRRARVMERDRAVHRAAELEELLNVRTGERDEANRRAAELGAACDAIHRSYMEIQNAFFWRMSQPLRRLLDLLRKSKSPRQIPAPGAEASAILPGTAPSEPTAPAKPSEIEKLRALVSEPKVYPLVSVCIPVYDRTDMLIESIESILAQTYPCVEIITVCDGSPEETLEIIRRYEKAGKIRAFYYEDNSGNAVRGRNRAIQEARGKYLAFQDSDDIAEARRIELSVRYMEEYQADVVYGSWRALIDGSREIDGLRDGDIVHSPDCDEKLLLEACVPCQSTVMVRTCALRRVGGLKTHMRYREDHELWLRLAHYGYRFKSIPEVLVNLRLHGGNLELTFKGDDEKWRQLMLQEYKKCHVRRPKIAYLIPGCGVSGGIAVICQHVNRLQERGYEMLLISENGETEISWFPGQSVKICDMAHAPMDLDVLVATGWSTAYSIRQIPARRKFYFVQSDETRFNPPNSRESIMAELTYSMDYEFLTEALWIQKWLRESYGKDAAYVPNGLDPDIIHPVSLPEEGGRKLRVLLEGPIAVPYKGMADAFAAVEGLDCEVWCVSSAGDPDPTWHCDRFFGRVNMDEMRYVYSACDIFLKMSRVEGFFGPPMEMMACGGACVVAKVTGYEEYIVDGVNALVVEPGDVTGAHNALKRLLGDSELRKKLAQGGKETAAAWRWESSIDTLEELYSDKEGR